MGRLANERHIHFDYTPEFVEHYRSQDQDFKDKCDEIGKPYGYSGMNVFYVFFFMYWSTTQAGGKHTVWRHAF